MTDNDSRLFTTSREAWSFALSHDDTSSFKATCIIVNGSNAGLTAEKSAEEAAAMNMLELLGMAMPAGATTGVNEFALVGDAALDLFMAVTAVRNHLSTAEAESLRPRILSNLALGGGRAGATAREAVVGEAVLASNELTDVLSRVIHFADEEVASDIEFEVRMSGD